MPALTTAFIGYLDCTCLAKLWNRTHDHEAGLCAFDLLELDGEDYRTKKIWTQRLLPVFARTSRQNSLPVSAARFAALPRGSNCDGALVRLVHGDKLGAPELSPLAD